jgi:hypothetical protein
VRIPALSKDNLAATATNEEGLDVLHWHWLAKATEREVSRIWLLSEKAPLLGGASFSVCHHPRCDFRLETSGWFARLLESILSKVERKACMRLHLW